MSKKIPMTKQDAARIQSSEAKANDGRVRKGSFTTRAQSAADKNQRPHNGPSTTDKPSGKRRGNNPPRRK